MSETSQPERMDYEDIGHLLVAKGRKLERGEGDPEENIREAVETLSRAASTRAREKTVDDNGRVSVGRDLAGTPGMILFHPDPEEPEPGPDPEGRHD